MKLKIYLQIGLVAAVSLVVAGCLGAKTNPTPTTVFGWQIMADWNGAAGKVEQTITVHTINWYLWYGIGVTGITEEPGSVGPPMWALRALQKGPEGSNPTLHIVVRDTDKNVVVAQRDLVGYGTDLVEINRPGSYQIEIDASSTWIARAIGQNP